MNGNPISLVHLNLLGHPLPKRQEEIKKLLASPNQSPTFPVKFRGQMENLVVHRVALGFPKYRLTNGRTMTDQVQYIEEHGKDPDFFGPSSNEVDEVQEAQHRLLVERARTKGPDNLFDYFEAKNTQEDPLILDHLGFVVNGNRRLATFRELYFRDNTEFAHFDHVRIVILPSTATDEDVLNVEAELQLKKDVKSDYDWADLAYMLRTHRKTRSDVEIAKVFDISVKEMVNQLNDLTLAEEYLEATGQSKLYSKLSNMEEAIRTLRKALDDRANLDTEPKRELYKRIVFGMLSSGQREGRIYSTIPDAKEALPEIIAQLQQGDILETGVVEDAVAQLEESAKEDSFDQLFGEPTNPATRKQELTIQAVVNLLTNGDNAQIVKDITKAAFDIIEDQREQKKIEKNEAGAAKLVEKANTMLANAISALDSQSRVKTPTILSHLNSIESSIATIREWAADA